MCILMLIGICNGVDLFSDSVGMVGKTGNSQFSMSCIIKGHTIKLISILLEEVQQLGTGQLMSDDG
jgi:hypothetical protein